MTYLMLDNAASQASQQPCKSVMLVHMSHLPVNVIFVTGTNGLLIHGQPGHPLTWTASQVDQDAFVLRKCCRWP